MAFQILQIEIYITLGALRLVRGILTSMPNIVGSFFRIKSALMICRVGKVSIILEEVTDMCQIEGAFSRLIIPQLSNDILLDSLLLFSRSLLVGEWSGARNVFCSALIRFFSFSRDEADIAIVN